MLIGGGRNSYFGIIFLKSSAAKSSGPFCAPNRIGQQDMHTQLERGRGELDATHVSSAQDASPERRVGNHRDTKLASRLQQSQLRVLDVERERRILELNGGNRVHGVRTAERFRRTFGKAEVLHFAGSRHAR